MTRARRAALLLLLAGAAGCMAPEPPEPRPGEYSRLVSLAPNLTEIVYAAGAGDALVGVSAYSDYPPEATELPVVGDAFTVDQERLRLLEPDALLVWESGMPAHVVDELRRAGFPVEVIRTRGLVDVAAALRRIGAITGYDSTAEAAATAYLEGLGRLRRQYGGAEPISVFFQVSARPLYTVNGSHFISELIEICGGRNVFADVGELAPAVDVEAVVERDPEVLLGTDAAGKDAFSEWRRWPEIAANRFGNHFLVPADEIGRATTRLVAAGESVCAALAVARRQRAAVAAPG